MEGSFSEEDQNFYSESRLPPSIDQRRQNQHDYDEARSPQLPPKLPFLTTSNLQAVTSNGYVDRAVINGGGSDPDAFYKSYRGAQQSVAGYTDLKANGMAATSEARPTPSFVRSNGNGTTSKFPPLPGARNNLKPSYRSASAPVDERALQNAKPQPASYGYERQQKTSVKDLKARFDGKNDQSSATLRKPPPRVNTRDNGVPGYMRERGAYQPRTAGNIDGVTTQRDAPGRVKSPSATKSTARTRFATEDQFSNNTLSSAARSPRSPRNPATGSIAQASKSMTNLSPTSPNHPSQPQSRKPLFGEVLPVGQLLPEIGHGIPSTATRRTSESTLRTSWSHHRNAEPDVDVSPSSPSAWYLGVTPALEDVDPNKPRSPVHNRNHSDSRDKKVNTMNGTYVVGPEVSPASRTPHSFENPANPPSRIPLASTRGSTPSDSSSSPSTRPNSPSNQYLSNGKLRNPERPWSPAGRAETPTNATITGAQRSRRGRTKTPENLNLNNSSLKAYISAPAPKTSPTLRSSRPRQPVSTVSSASTRQTAVDRTSSPQQVRTGMRVTRNADHSSRRIVDPGPVDFAAKRAEIQRAYTASYDRKKQEQIRAANLRRLSERHTKDSESDKGGGEIEGEFLATQSHPEIGGYKTHEPLHVSTSFTGQDNAQQYHSPSNLDSPTLGIPGSFVDDEPPQSATSTATELTDIDNEPQCAPATQRTVPRMISSHALPSYGLSVDEALHGMGLDSPNDAESIQIILDATPVEAIQPESTPTNEAFDRDPSPPGAYHETPPATNEPVFATTLTTASPKDATPEHSAPATPMESGGEDGVFNDVSKIHDESVVACQYQSQEHPEAAQAGVIEHPYPADPVKGTNNDLPTLTTTMASPLNEIVRDFLNTPFTDMEYECSDGIDGALSSEQGNYEDVYALEHSSTQFTRSSRSDEDFYARNQSTIRVTRSSHTSGWTDYSVRSDEFEQIYSPIPGAMEKKPTPPPKEISSSPRPGVPPKPDNYSPQPSPRLAEDSSIEASPSRHQLPPLTTGQSFGLGFSEPSPLSNPSHPLSPEHAPPPPPPIPSTAQGDASPAQPSRTPPPPSFYNKRPPSSVFHDSQNGASRDAESRRASEDANLARPSISTPRSSTQASAVDLPSGQTPMVSNTQMTGEEQEAAEKEKRRLFQRRMLIQELIDTESVYLKDMNVVEEIYKGTAEACPNFSAVDMKTIFRNTDEIIPFATAFLDDLKLAASSVYVIRKRKNRWIEAPAVVETDERLSVAATLTEVTDDEKDRKTSIGAVVCKHLHKMEAVYTEFIKLQDNANARLATLADDASVSVWLSECNSVAKDLTAAWDLDALLVKPVQRVTRYPLFFKEMLDRTPDDHPDQVLLTKAHTEATALLNNANDLKRRIEMVGKIVGRKRKESDVRSGIAKAFGRRAEKMQASNANRPPDDEVYVKLQEKFGHDFVKLQIVLRDFEFYTRQVATYVADFLRYLSSIELVVRLNPTPWPELESKWARFNMSMRDMGTVALEDHVSSVRKRAIEPIERIIAAYGPPNLAMKKRSKRRLDFEKYNAAQKQGKKVDDKLVEMVAQYEALNETLKLELPKLFAGSQKIGNICLVQFLGIQAEWFSIWQDKVRIVLEESQMPEDVSDIVDLFNRDYKYVQARAQELGICNGTIIDDGTKTRASSQSAMKDDDASTTSTKSKPRPSNLSSRDRGFSIASDKSPSLPTPDFAKRHSGQFSFSPLITNAPAIGIGLPQFSYHNQSSASNGHSRAGSGSPATPDASLGSRPHASSHGRPSTSRSFTSDGGIIRASSDYNTQQRRESGSTHNSVAHLQDGPLSSGRPYSGLFHSAMPLPDGPEDSQRSSRASSRDRNVSGAFNVLYLAASLFEFNIDATKSEAGYPYLTYGAGEIFDVIGEKGELWLAKNQDDPTDTVGWIWSKHFARLAND